MEVKIRFKQNILEFLICTLIVGLIMILFFEPFDNTFFAGLGVWIICVVIVLTILVAIIEKRIYKNEITFLTILFAVIGVFSIIINNQLYYKSMVSLMSVLEIPLVVLSVNNILSTNKIVRCIYKSFVIISLFFILLSFTSVSNIFETEYGTFQLHFLTLGYGNPNKTGMLLFGCLAVLFSYLFYLDNFKKKILIAMDMIYMLLLIYKTESRACIIIAALLVIFSFVENKKIINIFAKMCYVVPIIFVPLLISFPSKIMQSDLLGDAIDTGRTKIYMNVLNNMNLKDLIIGNYEYQFSNLHNAYLSVFATVGIIGVCVFAILYYFIYKKIGRNYKGKSGKVAFLAIALYGLHSSVEAAMFLSGSLYAAIIILLYILCINRTDTDYYVKG